MRVWCDSLGKCPQVAISPVWPSCVAQCYRAMRTQPPMDSYYSLTPPLAFEAMVGVGFYWCFWAWKNDLIEEYVVVHPEDTKYFVCNPCPIIYEQKSQTRFNIDFFFIILDQQAYFKIQVLVRNILQLFTTLINLKYKLVSGTYFFFT